jgi:GT2 family glycosyltransferase
MINRLAIIVPNWNTSNDIIEFLNTILKQNYELKKIKLVIVDNGSTDDSLIKIKRWIINNEKYLQKIILIHAEVNYGIAYAYNIGYKNIEYSTDLIIRGESDIVWDKNVIKNIVGIFNEDRKVGIVGGKSLLYSDNNKIDHGARGINWWTGNVYPIISDIKVECDCVTGPTFGIRTTILEDLGYFFRENAFLANELEITTRVKNRGFKAIFSPDILIYHKVAKTSSKLKNNRFIYVNSYEKMYFHLEYNHGIQLFSVITLMLIQGLKRIGLDRGMMIKGYIDSIISYYVKKRIFYRFSKVNMQLQLAKWVTDKNEGS